MRQGFINIDGAFAFIDDLSDNCPEGGKCDTNGDQHWTDSKGKEYWESEFSRYLRFSPQFRIFCIWEWFEENDIEIVESSCTCSKCRQVAADQHWYL